MTDRSAPDPQALTPHVLASRIQALDGRSFSAALPHVDLIDLSTIRRLFAQWVAVSRRDWWSWQEAWNHWISATPHWGTVRYVPARCPGCHGRRFDGRRGWLCHTCLGAGKGRALVTQPARRIPEPPLS